MPDAPLRVVLAGCGRTGGLVAEAALAAADLELAGVVIAHAQPAEALGLPGTVPVTTDPGALLGSADVLIDFTAPAATAKLAAAAARAGVAVVSGATDIGAAGEEALAAAARLVPVLHATNMSRGVCVLTHLAAQAARALESADLEIVEWHHRDKLDAPSGTALAIARALAGARGASPELTCGRSGPQPRQAGEIGIHAVRGGEWVGSHSVFLGTCGETLELTHKSENRRVFAAGALSCARFLAGRPPGRYRIEQALGLEAS